MEILYRSLHNLDLSMEDPVRKEIPSDFDSYITEYINFATNENKTSKMYSVPDHNTTVMHCIADLAVDVIQQGNMTADENLPIGDFGEADRMGSGTAYLNSRSSYYL